MNNSSPLENNWELALRIKEILSENCEKWKVFEKEKEEIRRKKEEKERRFQIIREKKRKWEDGKEDKTPNERWEKETMELEHYEMWWNIWENRRGHKSTLEQNIEELERRKRRTQWETQNREQEQTPPVERG